MKANILTVGVICSLVLIGVQNTTSMIWDGNPIVGIFSLLMLGIVLVSVIAFATRIETAKMVVSMLWYYGYAIVVCLMNGYFKVFMGEPTMIVTMAFWFFVFCIFYAATKNETIKLQKMVSFFLLLTIVCFVLYLGYYSANSTTGRLTGLNVVYYLTFMLPFLMISADDRICKIGIVIVAVATLLSGKRGAFFALIIAVGVYAQQKLKELPPQKRFRRFMIYAAICIVALIVMNIVVSKMGLNIIERISSLFNGEDKSGNGREDLWTNYLECMKNESLISNLFGRGYVSVLHNTRVKSILSGYAHNDFIQVLFDYGVIGLILLLNIVFKLVSLWKEMRSNKYIYHSQFIVSICIFFCGAMVSMVILFPQWFLSMAAFWGCIIGDYEKEMEQKSNENSICF